MSPSPDRQVLLVLRTRMLPTTPVGLRPAPIPADNRTEIPIVPFLSHRLNSIGRQIEFAAEVTVEVGDVIHSYVVRS